MTKKQTKKNHYMKKGFTALLIANVLASPMITNFAPQVGMAAESDLQSKSISTMANTTGAAAIDDPVRMPVIGNVMDTKISDYGIFGFNATPGSTVYVTFGSITRTVTVGSTGYWAITALDGLVPANMAVGTKVSAYAVLNGVYSKTDTTYVKTAVRGPGTNGDGTGIAIPVVSKPVTSRDTTISFSASSTTTLYANINGQIYTTPASAESLTIPRQAPGTEIILYCVEGNHTGYLGRTVVLYEEGDALATPTVNTVKDNQTLVTGTGPANTTLTLYVNGNAVGTGTVSSTGQYSINMNSTYPAGTIIQAKAVNSYGDESPYGSTTVITSVSLAAPTINTVKSTDTVVTGTSTPNTQIVLTINGTQYTGTTGSNGQYSVTIPKQAVGTLVTAQAKSGTDTSPTTSTTVIAGTIATPTINTVTTDDTLVKGTAPANSKVTLTIPQGDGSTKTWAGTADSSGNYAITIAKQAVGTKIEVIAEKDGITSDKASTTVIQGALKTPTINGLTTDDTLVKGTAPANSKVTLTIPQGDGSTKTWDWHS
ncbi:hypothetical protein MFLO_13845 [Listeria floridensis FSL S10-1187]|uniref:Bacterial Ig domain-containing protein n=1 Tax=Listeria floridensis FSL S10-1187 TaxID=1265817 RepID=A0ABN0RC92_9LIST|nr:Ig-like domain-containing protein [Listeria floridensis]EUJ26959.1 hypothetical protein MFLO_13845 [Listeria floridensis FSL S10-1187]